MDWDNLRIFLALARGGTVVEAAKKLNVDHSTVSRRLASLEATLGITLFDRAGRRLKITESGSKLRKTAEKLESTLISELALIDEAKAQRSGTVRIGAPEGFGVGYLAGRLGLIADTYPEISIELIALPRSYSLAQREVDIAITLDRPSTGDVTLRRLTDYRLQFYGTKSYFDRYGVPMSAGDLAAHRLCGYIDQLLHSKELDFLDAVGSGLRPRLRCTSVVAQVNMIAQGSVIGILPTFMASVNPAFIPALPEAALTRTYWLSVHNDQRRAERVRLISSLLVRLARQDQALFMG